MRKNILILLLIVVIIVTGCSGGAVDYSDADENISTGDTNSETIVDKDESSVIEEDNQTEIEENNEDAVRPNIEKGVIYEHENITITAKTIEYEELFGPEIKLLLENESDTDIIVQAKYCTINDIMMSTMFSSEIAAGKKSNESIGFMYSDFESFGIKDIKDIELKLNILNAESFSTIYTSDKIVLNTDIIDTYEQEYYDNGTVAFNKKDVKVIVKKVDKESSFLGSEVLVYIENNSDVDLTIQVRDVSINGFMINPMFSSDIISGKKAYDTITFLQSDLEENDITNIENIELYFTAIDDNWKNFIETDIVKINFNE